MLRDCFNVNVCVCCCLCDTCDIATSTPAILITPYARALHNSCTMQIGMDQAEFGRLLFWECVPPVPHCYFVTLCAGTSISWNRWWGAGTQQVCALRMLRLQVPHLTRNARVRCRLAPNACACQVRTRCDTRRMRADHRQRPWSNRSATCSRAGQNCAVRPPLLQHCLLSSRTIALSIFKPKKQTPYLEPQTLNPKP